MPIWPCAWVSYIEGMWVKWKWKLHTVLISSAAGGQWTVSCDSKFSAVRTVTAFHWLSSWVGFGVSLGLVVKQNIPADVRNWILVNQILFIDWNKPTVTCNVRTCIGMVTVHYRIFNLAGLGNFGIHILKILLEQYIWYLCMILWLMWIGICAWCIFCW
jgi:hypothetical protein